MNSRYFGAVCARLCAYKTNQSGTFLAWEDGSTKQEGVMEITTE